MGRRYNYKEFKPPFLPAHEIGTSQYCLVLDLDETLIHYVENGPDSYFLVRPFCMEFLDELSKYYEIVVFTAGVQEYADWVIDQIDAEGRIKHRLYREHTFISQQDKALLIKNASTDRAGTANASGQNIPIILKDLSKIGRPLEKTIIVDNIADNFLLQKDNGIFIKSWYDDPYDTELRDLIPLLKQIVLLNIPDVRKCLKDYRDQMSRMITESGGTHNSVLQGTK